jgi:Tfp pilus assembly protein PilF
MLLSAACRQSGLPAPGSKTYTDLCSAFYLGLAGLQAGEDVRAKEYLTRATQIAPAEPASWADLGILQVRQQQFDAALSSVEQARAAAPSESRIEALLGLVETRRGKLPEASSHFKKAVELDPHNLRAVYSLATQSEDENTPQGQAKAQELLQDILKQQPTNAAVLLEDLRMAAKRGEADEARRAYASLQPLASNWPDAGRQQFQAVGQVLNGANNRQAAVQVQFLRNILLRVPTYRQDLDAIKTPATLVAEPFTRFLRLPSPSSEPAPPDMQTRFVQEKATFTPQGKASWIGDVSLDGNTLTVAWADETSLHLQSGATLRLPGNQKGAVGGSMIAFADFNYDFKTDVAIATPSGLKLYLQDTPTEFRDVTATVKLPASIVAGSYAGVWPFDFDLDGDLDLVLGMPNAEPLVLRNNGDGSFTPVRPFKQEVTGMTAFAAADLDGDGDPDAAVIDGAGKLHVLMNQRLGLFTPRAVPENVASDVRSVTSADINGDGILDLVLLQRSGSVVRLSQKPGGLDWESAELIRGADPANTLLVADLDNNGALDLLIGNRAYLNDGHSLSPIPTTLPGSASALGDQNGDGRLDVLALDSSGQPAQLLNRGSKNYAWQLIRTRAAHATGDQRINSFGIGGEMEIRSDLLAQKQIIESPLLHFGLGEHTSVQFARIVWPNGFIQAEFDLKANQSILAEQRIKGSCPMLFAWNGKGMQFLKDVGPWGSALGLNVNAQGKGIYGTREWFNVREDQLPAHEGFYDLRITAEYWETYYMDHYSLLAVDHPADSEVYTDERFALPSPTPNLITTTVTKPFVRATDDNGNDVTNVVRDLDSQFLDNFGRAQYQGLTRKHWVELELPPNVPTSELYLVGQGWIHDTDATIVKAQAQNSTAHPEQISIAVPDSSGCWKTVRANLGFPKGRVKTIILDISNVFQPNAPRRLRLQTNLELFWDKLAWGTKSPASDQIKVQHLDLAAADLNFRGFSLITKKDASSPELPQYDLVQESDGRWHDQEGYATRYGDVRPLLMNIDDRYVITSPGDELRMKFRALEKPAAGWRRDFILICDGWVKDGDYNSTFAGTVLPLPFHSMTDYVVPATTLEADHAYQMHPDDWRDYQTRYVSADHFSTALWKRE